MPSAQHKDASMHALAVLLHHPSVAADPQKICKLLQVCKAWRSAVQQTPAASTDIDYNFTVSWQQYSKVLGLAAWIPKFCGSIRSIRFCRDMCGLGGYAEFEAALAAAQQSMEFALQLAAAGATGAAAAHGRQRWGLNSYISNLAASEALLAALPAATLTRLEVLAPAGSSSSWVSTILQLTSLKNLAVEFPFSCKLDQQLVSASVQLKQLTRLRLDNLALDSDLQQLPKQLQRLELEFKDPAGNHIKRIELQHLVCLQQLMLRISEASPVSALPVQLQGLTIFADVLHHGPIMSTLGVPQLKQLMFLEVHCYSEGAGTLRSLAGLPQLQELTLSCNTRKQQGWEEPIGAAVWRDVPQLRALDVTMWDGIRSAQLVRLLGHVGVVTQLTRLRLEILEFKYVAQEQLMVCEQLSRLSNLVDLELQMQPSAAGSDFRPAEKQDAQHLTALKQLTRLCIEHRCPHIDPTNLCLLACNLANLQCLGLFDALGPDRTAALPVIGKLTQLKQLVYYPPCSPADAQRGLLFLTGLTRLTELQGFEAATQAAIDRFWATITYA